MKNLKFKQPIKKTNKEDFIGIKDESKLTFELPIELHKEFKAKCSKGGKKMKEVIVGLIQKYVKQ